MKRYIKCFEQIKDIVYESRKGVGKIVKITDHFGSSEYILLDVNGDFIDRDINVNKLHRKLWDMKPQSIDVESSTSTDRSKRNSCVRSNYISCAERFDPVNSSPEELTEYIYDAIDEAFDETNFVEEDLEQYKDTFTNELIKALNRLNLGDMQVETDFGTLTGDTKKIANTVVKAYIQAYKEGRLG